MFVSISGMVRAEFHRALSVREQAAGSGHDGRVLPGPHQHPGADFAILKSIVADKIVKKLEFL
jgi:hypothetical protein